MSAITTLPTLDEESDDSEEYSISYHRAPNFSRPRPASSQKNVPPSRGSGSVHAISAFHEPNRDLPDEPRFSLESERTDNTSSENSAASEFAWDGERGELVSRKQPRNFDSQRYMSRSDNGRPKTSSTTGSKKSGVTIGIPSNSSSETSIQRQKIEKRVSVDQQSERVSMTTAGDFEDARSHHTVSESGDSGSFDTEGNWQSSDHDISGLSEAEIRKLRKKGINPALYAEMKAAKKGKSKWVGPLLGNSFLG